MRPRRLRVKGYTAFVEEADVDFEGLDLFAITGPTGAGKTSLLQAMTIALYGRAPKLGDDLRQLISPFAERAQFYFEFRAHGCCYRITRVMFRARPTTVALEAQGADGQWETLTRGVREANARVEQILGLDFDSFTKVVLLPQNEFDAFLRGKPEERRSILTRLLSLEIYGRIQQRANQVAADARTQAELLTGLLERDYADATPEHLAGVQEARAAAEAAVEIVTARLAAFERALAVAFDARQRRLAHHTASADLVSHERTLSAAGDEHKTAAAALAVIDRDVQTITARLESILYDADRHLLLARAAERATRLGEVVVALTRLDGDDAAGQVQAGKLVRRRDELVQAVAEAERALVSAEDAEERSRADFQERQRRFGTRATIAGLIERERRYRVDREHEGDAERTREALTARQVELTTAREGLGADQAAASARLEEAQRVREERERALEACRAMQGQAAALGERLVSARDRATRAQTAVEQARTEAARRQAVLRGVEEARHAAQEVVRAAEEDLRHLEQAHAAHTLRATLTVGQPCPVCETKVRTVPAVEPVDDLERARQSLEEARGRLDQAQRDEQRAAADVVAADEALRDRTSGWEEIRSELDGIAAELRGVLLPELRDGVHWPQVLQGRVDMAASNREAAARDVDEARRRGTEVDSEIVGVEAELRTLPAQIDERRRTLLSIRERCEETERILAAVLGGHSGPDAAVKLAEIDAGLGAAEAALASASADAQGARTGLAQAQAAAARAEREIETEVDRARARGEERARLTCERDEIQGALQEVVSGRADPVEAIASELRALTDARTRRDKVGRELETRQQEHDRTARRVTELIARAGMLESQLDELQQREVAGRAAMDAALVDLTARLAEAGLTLAAGDGDEHAQLTGVVQRARTERDAAVRRSAALGAEEQALAEKIARAVECREQRDAARTRMEVARELGQLLGANNLQTYLLGDAMRVLVEDGSLHLQRLSDGRYRLQAEDLDFHVVDAWNGDAVRSVKTLSGGETFLTSLALALALAERLADLAAGAHGHEALESLFVDEGFGALDTEETLETVVQAIEALRAHDRLVGIVTHLTPLAERMPAQIKVRKAPEGSHVEMVK